MKLSRRIDRILAVCIIVMLAAVFAVIGMVSHRVAFAEGETEATAAEESTTEVAKAKYVTIYDDGEKLIVRTEARTVGEAIDRADIILNNGDIVDPGIETEINADNFFINIYRARPVIVKDGITEKYLMTASYDVRVIAAQAGIMVYDGDEIRLVPNTNFLETGIANVYELTRNGGRTVTEEVEIGFGEQTVRDPNLENGKTEVRQLGEVGMRRETYQVYYVNNREISRELVSEEIVREPVPRIIAIGAKRSVPPEAATCAEWARQAGVSESDLAAAVDLIYHESGCRVDAANAYSGAYGIPQALPGSKMASAGADWETNPVTQIRWMAGYVSRYGGWQGAIEFWYTHGWY